MKIMLDKQGYSCYYKDIKKVAPQIIRLEILTMYFVNCGIHYTYFKTYREAEIFCGERGIHPENIYEADDDE